MALRGVGYLTRFTLKFFVIYFGYHTRSNTTPHLKKEPNEKKGPIACWPKFLQSLGLALLLRVMCVLQS